jgi:hypothetical protein
MRDLSVLIPARHEQWLKPTIDDVLAHKRADTDVIVVCDGEPPLEPIPQHPDVTLVILPQAIGQRAATNLAASLSDARYVMKLDGHAAVAEGFDVELIETAQDLEPQALQIPRQYHLHVYNWRCRHCAFETHHGPKPTICKICGGVDLEQVMFWERRGRRRGRFSTEADDGRYIFSDAWCFDSNLHFQYFGAHERRRPTRPVIETMSFLGACFFCSREYFWQIGGLDTNHGSWGQYATELSCKVWLSGGRVLTNRRTWFAHFFRVGGIGFPYPLSAAQVDHARAYSQQMWRGNQWASQTKPLRWLVEKFWEVPGWTERQLEALPRELRTTVAA